VIDRFVGELTKQLQFGEHLEVLRRCMQHTPVLRRNGEQVFIETENGEIAAAYKFQPLTALKALVTFGDSCMEGS